MLTNKLIIILLLFLDFNFVLAIDKQNNTMPIDTQQFLKSKGFKFHGIISDIFSSREDSIENQQEITRISVSFNLNKSGIKPILLSKSVKLSQADIDTIFSDDFEGDFPGTNWQRWRCIAWLK